MENVIGFIFYIDESYICRVFFGREEKRTRRMNFLSIINMRVNLPSDPKNMHMKGLRVKLCRLCTSSFIHSRFPNAFISGPRLPMI